MSQKARFEFKILELCEVPCQNKTMWRVGPCPAPLPFLFSTPKLHSYLPKIQLPLASPWINIDSQILKIISLHIRHKTLKITSIFSHILRVFSKPLWADNDNQLPVIMQDIDIGSLNILYRYQHFFFLEPSISVKQDSKFIYTYTHSYTHANSFSY